MLPMVLFALAAAAEPSVHQREVERAVFELCPQAITGSFSLDNEAQVTAAGYRTAAPRETPGGPMPRIYGGSGTDQIEISARRDGESATCAVWFGGPANRALLRSVRRRARADGFDGGRPVRLGDDTPIQMLRNGEGRSLVIIEGNAGGSLPFDPVTTVIRTTGTGD